MPEVTWHDGKKFQIILNPKTEVIRIFDDFELFRF